MFFCPRPGPGPRSLHYPISSWASWAHFDTTSATAETIPTDDILGLAQSFVRTISSDYSIINLLRKMTKLRRRIIKENTVESQSHKRETAPISIGIRSRLPIIFLLHLLLLHSIIPAGVLKLSRRASERRAHTRTQTEGNTSLEVDRTSSVNPSNDGTPSFSPLQNLTRSLLLFFFLLLLLHSFTFISLSILQVSFEPSLSLCPLPESCFSLFQV